MGKIGDKFAIILLWLNGAKGFFDQVIVEVTTALPEVTLGKVDHWMFFLVLLGTFSSQEKSKLSVIVAIFNLTEKKITVMSVFTSKSVSKLVLLTENLGTSSIL